MDENISAPTDGAPNATDDAATTVSTESAAAQSGKKPQKKHKKKHNYWAIKITIVTLFLSAFISYLTEITSSAGNIAITVVLLFFIVLAGIIARSWNCGIPWSRRLSHRHGPRKVQDSDPPAG